MGTTVLDQAGCGCIDMGSSTDGVVEPASPYTALQYHFGMLLGVDDLEAAQAYPRGKIRLHNAWLHREGVVWGLNVLFNARRELAVTPGLALDAAGHELHLDATACVDLGKWYDKYKDDPGYTFTTDDNGGIHFDVHVVARFRACLARPVPAIADPCADGGGDIAYSRVSETIELLLRPGLAPDKLRPYIRLRILFALLPDDAKYDDVRLRREAILALPLEQQPAAYLAAFRDFAAFDEIDLGPQVDAAGAINSLFPEDPTEVVLANVAGVVVGAAAGVVGSALLDPLPAPDVRVRPSHVATSTIQELLCGPLFSGTLATAPPPASPVSPDARATAATGGARIDPATSSIDSPRRISLGVVGALDSASVSTTQCTVTTYTKADGWSTLDLSDVRLSPDGAVLIIALKESVPKQQLVRVVVRGTGPQPILGSDLTPLAGTVGGPAGTPHDGHDAAIMLQRS